MADPGRSLISLFFESFSDYSIYYVVFPFSFIHLKLASSSSSTIGIFDACRDLRRRVRRNFKDSLTFVDFYWIECAILFLVQTSLIMKAYFIFLFLFFLTFHLFMMPLCYIIYWWMQQKMELTRTSSFSWQNLNQPDLLKNLILLDLGFSYNSSWNKRNRF